METITCTNCGNSNSVDFKYCMNCGHTLPAVSRTPVSSITEEKPRKKFDARILVPVFTCLFLYGMIALGIFAAGKLEGLRKTSFTANVIDQTVTTINNAAPIQVDEVTVLEGAERVDPYTIQYNYQLLDIDTSVMDTLSFKASMEPTILSFIRTSGELAGLRMMETDFIYAYKDLSSNPYCSIIITSDQYLDESGEVTSEDDN
ncbi:MAG: zinc ribbon domain-containing protein [Bacteroidota bacterium]